MSNNRVIICFITLNYIGVHMRKSFLILSTAFVALSYQSNLHATNGWNDDEMTRAIQASLQGQERDIHISVPFTGPGTTITIPDKYEFVLAKVVNNYSPEEDDELMQ